MRIWNLRMSPWGGGIDFKLMTGGSFCNRLTLSSINSISLNFTLYSSFNFLIFNLIIFIFCTFISFKNSTSPISFYTFNLIIFIYFTLSITFSITFNFRRRFSIKFNSTKKNALSFSTKSTIITVKSLMFNFNYKINNNSFTKLIKNNSIMSK